MEKKKTSAIIIDRMPYRESDLLVSFFSREDGLLRGIAPAAQKSAKRFGGLLEPFSRIELTYVEKEGRNLVRLETAAELKGPSLDSTDLFGYALGGYYCELITALCPEAEKQPDLYDLFDLALQMIASGQLQPQLSPVFDLKFLQLLGYAPHVESCLRCRTEPIQCGRIYFDLSGGGICCERCLSPEEHRRPLSAGVAAFWRQALMLSPDRALRLRASKPQALETTRLLPPFVEYISGRKLKTKEFLQSMIEARIKD
jgi:DNA repair protein RecO (recombination protein O)